MLVRESRTNSAAPVIAVVATMAALSAHVTTAVVSERAYVQGPAVSWLDHFPQRCIWRTCVGSREAAVGAFGATV